MVVAGTTMVVSENQVPSPFSLFRKVNRKYHLYFWLSNRSQYFKNKSCSSTGIPDDLPIIGLNIPGIKQLTVLNPTSHLGLTQSPALGYIAASHAFDELYKSHSRIPLNLSEYRLHRFQADINQLRQKGATTLDFSGQR